MALHIREAEVRELLTMGETLEAVEDALREQGAGRAPNRPRARVQAPSGLLHVLPGAVPARGGLGLKVYSSSRGGTKFLVLLYSSESGELLALIEADWLGRLRTGAASGVATKYLARPDATTVALFGAGNQAETQLLAVAAIRPLREVAVIGRDPARRDAFIAKMAPRLAGVALRPGEPEEATRAADIVITITTSREPLFDGAWLKPGAHVNAAGSNALARREIDDETVRRSATIAIDSREQGRLEAGDLAGPIERGLTSWDRVVELGRIIAGAAPGRAAADDITLFESLGIAVEDIAPATIVYHKARERGLGAEIPLWAD